MTHQRRHLRIDPAPRSRTAHSRPNSIFRLFEDITNQPLVRIVASCYRDASDMFNSPARQARHRLWSLRQLASIQSIPPLRRQKFQHHDLLVCSRSRKFLLRIKPSPMASRPRQYPQPSRLSLIAGTAPIALPPAAPPLLPSNPLSKTHRARHHRPRRLHQHHRLMRRLIDTQTSSRHPTR